MRLRKLLIAIPAALLVLATSLVGTSSAQTRTVTVTPNPIPVTANQTSATVTVNWTGQDPMALMFLRVCQKSISDPTINISLDCSSLSELNPNGTADGNGTIQMEVFRGESPDGDVGAGSWGCFAADDTAPEGVKKNTTCYVRVTNNSLFNTDDDAEAAFTFSVGGDVVPEAPLGILLPSLGAVVAIGGFFFLRRRSALS